MIANIHSFESLAGVDGKGLRYAVFFNGCPLRCVYCHNPDTWQGDGQKFTPLELFNKIKRYKSYFSKNGGVTFSGGEPLLHASFINETYNLLKDENINYTLDTSANVKLTEDVCVALKNASLSIVDLKFYSEESYLTYTQGSLNKVLKVLDFLEEQNKPVWIRTVIVPTINDNIAFIDKYLKIVKRYKCVEKYELLPFHTLGFFKYDNLSIVNPLKDLNNLDNEKLIKLQSYVDKNLIK